MFQHASRPAASRGTSFVWTLPPHFGVDVARKVRDIRWLDAPEAHDYPSALSYLSLVYPVTRARALVAKLRRAGVTVFKAKDIFRASSLSSLGVSNARVERDRKMIAKGTPLSPLLLVRDPALGKVVIADGYHRLCAIYSYNEDAEVPCQIV